MSTTYLSVNVHLEPKGSWHVGMHGLPQALYFHVQIENDGNPKVSAVK